MNLEQIHSLSKKIERILESSRVLKAENGHLRAKNEELQLKVTDTESKIQVILDESAKKDEAILLQKNVIEDQKNKINEVSKVMEQEVTNMTNTKEQLATLIDDYNEMVVKLEETQQKNEALQQSINEKEEEFTALTEEKESLKQESIELKRELELKTAQANEKEAEMQTLLESQGALESELESLKNELTLKDETISSMKQDYETLVSENESLNETLQEVQQKFEDLNNMLQNTLDLEVAEQGSDVSLDDTTQMEAIRSELDLSVPHISEETFEEDSIEEETFEKDTFEEAPLEESSAESPSEEPSLEESPSNEADIEEKEEENMAKLREEALEMDFSDPIPLEEKKEEPKEPESQNNQKDHGNYFRLKWMMSNDPFGVGSK